MESERVVVEAIKEARLSQSFSVTVKAAFTDVIVLPIRKNC